MPYSLRGEFEHRGVISGGLLYLRAADALDLVRRCRAARFDVWGIESFWRSENGTMPDMSQRIRLGSLAHFSDPEWRYAQAEAFLRQRLDTDLWFDVTTD